MGGGKYLTNRYTYLNHLTKLCSGDWKGGFLFINESVGEINKLQLKSGKIIWVQNVLKIVL